MNLYSQIGEIFLIMLVGFYGNKKKILNEEINKGLSSLLINITLPLLIINSFNIKYNSEIILNLFKSLGYSFLSFLIIILISKLLYSKVNGEKKEILKFATVFSNCGFIGFPIIESIYGKEGLAYASIFNMAFTVFLWSYGVMLFNGKENIKDLKKIFINPGIISVVIGAVVMVSPVKMPLVIENVISMVGGMTTPISMIITGSMMANVSMRKGIKDIYLYYGVFAKLILVPVILYTIVIILGIKSLPTNVIIACEAMPVAATTSIFAENYNKNKDFAAFTVFISTLFSIVTIPLMLRFIT
ncbi:AEC family transporter [Clostridium sp. YIM B02551]|uniref:AEC family transporter n=1 Tax=Clostridium sp. YIM B02551 TaxID=2910679 RepID=UPI001EEA7E36|nr:AEC family transporter [Clostridium sp. YIM B02551]